ncbi:MAG: hypothetical protein LC637_08000 [Xanthomonadaceae bacterium]|nr:hypothetical protein [Xanthomonadaceae bacterium]
MSTSRKISPKFEGRIQPWGNSMGLRITRAVGEAAQLGKGTWVTMELTDEGLLIRPKESPRKTWTEEELLEGIDSYRAHADELPELIAHEYSD